MGRSPSLLQMQAVWRLQGWARHADVHACWPFALRQSSPRRLLHPTPATSYAEVESLMEEEERLQVAVRRC